MNLYGEKKSSYFGDARLEVIPLLPAKAGRVFEVGCGNGATLSHLKSAGLCSWAGGAELFAQPLEGNIDLFVEGDIEKMDLPLEPGSIDVMLCLDVLEHLVDPWLAARRLAGYLKPGGTMVISLPNIRNIKILAPLVLMGKWEYEQSGILDKTHLRFFTQASAVQLLEQAGLAVVETPAYFSDKGRAKRVDRLTLGLLRPFLQFQIILKAVKPVS